MTKLALVLTGSLVLAGASVVAEEHDMHVSSVASTPQWEKVKSLAGEWDGYGMEAGKRVPTHVSVRPTGDGSAMMHVIDAGTPHEMVTMFAMDKNDLLATHYCSAHNQPRLLAQPGGDPSRIVFDFKDGTNIRPGDGYMKRLAVTFVDADHHNEEWSYDENGKVTAMTFMLTRVKPAAAR